jgi:hypothetical protein
VIAVLLKMMILPEFAIYAYDVDMMTWRLTAFIVDMMILVQSV